MVNLFRSLLEYTFHFNDKVLDSLITTAAVPEKSLFLINHTINAHEIWNSRIEQKVCNTGVWEVRPLETLRQANIKNFENSTRLIAEHDFDKIVQYTNSKGVVFENTIRDMLFHMINHSTYHRGQIASDCKENGITPLVSDYIFYKRDM